MTNYRYTLDSSSRKFICPNCNQKRMVKYIDTCTDEYLPDEYGKCDREIKCGYHLNPYKAGYHKNGSNTIYTNEAVSINNKKIFLKSNLQKEQSKEFIPIPEEILIGTMKDYQNNNFIQFLCSKYGEKAVAQKIEDYFVGTVGRYTSFPYIDSKGMCKIIALIGYDENCKRIKNISLTNLHFHLKLEYEKIGQAPPIWLKGYLQNEKKISCLFGEHLINLSDNEFKPIAIVEAPKTAFIASLVYDSYVWLAAGALSYLTEQRLKVLSGREVYLFPDTSTNSRAFELWNSKAKPFGFICLNLLENIATEAEKEEGYDLADYILEHGFNTYSYLL